MPATQAKLQYQCKAVGPTPLTRLQLVMSVAPLPTDDLQPFDANLIGDSVSTVGKTVTRTLIFSLGATFNGMFPPGTDQACLFRDIYTHILGNELQSMITEVAPVIS